MATTRYPRVGNTVVREFGEAYSLTWKITKIAKHGRQATAHTEGLGSRQIFRGRFGSWKFSGDLVVFDDGAQAAVSDGAEVIFEGDVNAGEEEPLPVTTEVFGSDWDDRMDALDLVKPLVAEAVRIFQESLDVRVSAEQRKVDPRKSPQVAQAYQRFIGACEILCRMWRVLGLSDLDMTPDRARRIVQNEHLREAEAARKDNCSTPQGLFDAVREHAQEHYADGTGWDNVVEAYEDADLIELIRQSPDQSRTGVIAYVGQIVEAVQEIKDQRRPIAGWHY